MHRLLLLPVGIPPSNPDDDGGATSVVIIVLVGAFVLLAPSIVLGYAVKAAEREDRERGI